MHHSTSYEHASSNQEAFVTQQVSIRFPGGPPLHRRGPGIVMMYGLPGSGKSTAAKLLADQASKDGRDAVVLDVDAVRLEVLDDMHEHWDPALPQGPLYQFKRDVIIKTYEELDMRMVQGLQEGKLVVYAGNPQTQQERNKAQVAAANGLPGVPCVTVWTDTDPGLALKRATDAADTTRPFAGSVNPAILARDHALAEPPSKNGTEPYARLAGEWGSSDIAQLYQELYPREERL